MYMQHGIILIVGIYAVATGENQRAELQALIPGTRIVIVIDHNYSE